MSSIKPTKVVSGIPATTPFVGPEAIEREMGRAFELRLGANESLFGASPKAVEAMQARAAQGHLYGDPEGYELRAEIARLNSVEVENVVLAGGIDELLMLFARAYVAPGEPVFTTLGSYPTFEYAINSVGGRLERIPYKDDRVDLDGIAFWARNVVYVANPDNPSGTFHPISVIRDFARELPEDSLLLLDEAYADFAPELAPFNPDNPAVVRLRTFSKAHGMAGIRVGYALAHAAHVKTLNKIRMHFGVSSVAQAGALASLRDPGHVQNVVSQTRETRQWLAKEIGFPSLPSETNFLTVDLGTEEKATATLMALRQQGVFIRKPMVEPLDRCIRVTIGRREDMELFLERFNQVVQKS